MLRIAICDDDVNFTKQISNMISRWQAKPSGTIWECFDNGDALVAAHRATPYDIILLDIVMPMLDGIETAREIRRTDRNAKLVFLTSSPEFAVESYTVKASNYLLKPFSEGAVFACLEELVAELSAHARTITVRGIYSVQKLPLDSIEYVEAQNKHIVFTLQNGTTIETTDPLRLYEDKLTLNDCFFKCHRSYIVNMNHISTYTLKEIQMHSGCRIPISRNYQKAFEAAYFSTLFGKAGESK